MQLALQKEQRIITKLKMDQIIKSKIIYHTLMSSPTLTSQNSYPYSQYRPGSHSDAQQQLRSLLSLVQQYYQHYEQILQDNREMLKDNGSIYDFISKINNKSQQEINGLYEAMKSMRKMLEQIFNKTMSLLPEISKEMGDVKGKIGMMQQQIDDKQLVIEGLKQSKTAVEKHLSEITLMYQKSRYDNLELSEKINQKQQQFQTESREIRKTFLEVTESSEQEKKILQEMYESNQKMSVNMHELQKQKNMLENEVKKLTKQLQKSSLKIQAMGSEMGKKQQKIKQYENELQFIQTSTKKVRAYSNASNHNSSEPQQHYNDIRQSFNQINQDPIKKNDKTKLNEELSNYQMPTVKELNGSFIMGSGIKRSIGQQSDYVSEYEDAPNKTAKSSIITSQNLNTSIQQPQLQAQPPSPFSKNKDITDPYFSHYILIVISISEDKIRL